MSEPVPTGVDRLANLRDVADASAALRRGALWRSAQPMTGDAVPTEVAGWPPRTVVDLRSAAERDGDHPLLAAAARVHSVELLDVTGDFRGPGQRLPTLAEVYASMLEPGTGLVRAVTLVADEPGPTLVHCAAGKDRTGLVVALALRLVGVPPQAVVADFVLTTAAMPAVMARLAAGSPLPPGVDLSTLPREYFEAPAGALERVLAVWDAHPGGVTGWASAHGGDPSLADRLRDRLTPA